MPTIFDALGSAALTRLAEWGAVWFVQSALLTAAGLLAAAAARRFGAAAQSMIYRTTLAAVLAAPVVAAFAGCLGFRGWSIDLGHLGGTPEGVASPQSANASTSSMASAAPGREIDLRGNRRSPAEESNEIAGPPDRVAVEAPGSLGSRVDVSHDYSTQAAGGLALLWLTISLALLVRIVRSWLVGRSLCRVSAEADQATLAAALALARHYGITRPAIRCSAFITSPCVVGILRPMILLNDGPALDVSDVLAHELAHVARRDGVWNLLRQITTACLFPQPLVWLLSRRIEASAEEVCDDYAVGLGTDRVRYAERLWNLAALSLPAASAAVGIKTPRSALARRVSRVLDSSRELSTRVGPRQGAAIAAGGIALLLVAGIAGAARGPADDKVAAAFASDPAGPGLGVSGDQPARATSDAAPEAQQSKARKGRLFARGFVFQNDQLQGMSIVSIDPETGAWKRLVEKKPGGVVAVSPDGQTLFYDFYDGPEGLWNGDAQANANPGKVHGESGLVVFSPDSRSILLTTFKSKDGKPDFSQPIVTKMGLDGSDAVPVAALAGWEVRDWSSDGRWLLAEKNGLLHLVRPDGSESRPLLTRHCGYERFSPDGKQVIYTFLWNGMGQWNGTIQLIDVDGTNDRVFAQEPDMTHVAGPHFSPDGKHVAAVLFDLQDGAQHADPKVSHPRLVVYETAKPEPKRLELPRQDDWDFYPTGELEWR